MTQQPGNTTLTAFSHMHPDDLARWLAEGIRTYYSPEATTAPPFRFAQQWIGGPGSDSLVDDLVRIYEKAVPQDAKETFRRTVGRVLSTWAARTSFPARGIEDLVNLIGRIDADECLTWLPQVVRDGRPGKEPSWLLAESIRSSKQLLPSPEAVDALYGLVTLKNFDPAYCFDVLTELCLAVSDRWIEHMRVLNHKLVELYSKAQKEDLVGEFYEEQRYFLNYFIENIPLQTVKRHLKPDELDWILDPQFDRVTSLLNGLFDETLGMLRVSKKTLPGTKEGIVYIFDIFLKNGLGSVSLRFREKDKTLLEKIFREVPPLYPVTDTFMYLLENSLGVPTDTPKVQRAKKNLQRLEKAQEPEEATV